MCHLCDRNRGEGGAGGNSALLSIGRVGVAPEPEQPIRTVYLLYYLECLGVICCILGSLGESSRQPIAYNSKNGPQEPFQIKASWGDDSLNPLLS